MNKSTIVFIFSVFLGVLGVSLIDLDRGLIEDSIFDMTGVGLILLGSYLHSNRRVI